MLRLVFFISEFTDHPENNNLMEKFSAMPNDINAVLATFKQTGYVTTKETKKIVEFQSPGGQIIYILKEASRLNRIRLVVHPGNVADALRKLEGVDEISDDYRHHSNMTRFPKRQNGGKNDIPYGWQVNLQTISGLSKFLPKFGEICL
jgi:hypothetical protein